MNEVDYASTIPMIPRCAFCDAIADASEYCYGCRHYICAKCDLNVSMPPGDHHHDLHLRESAEDE